MESNIVTAVAGRRGTDHSLIPRTVLFGNPQRVEPAISPDGHRLAWIAPDGGVLNVWVRDLDAVPGSERVVTRDRDRGIHTFAWGPAGDRILYLRDHDGDENWVLHDVHLETGVERVLTPIQDVQASILKISKHCPGHILVMINLVRAEAHDVYRLDLDSGALTKVCDDRGFVMCVADEALTVRAALAPLPDGGAVVLVRDTDGSPWRPLFQVGHEDAMSTTPLAFSPDGTRLLCITSDGAEAAQLVWVDSTTADRTVLVADPTFDVATAVLHVDTNEPRVAFVDGERLTPVVLDPGIADDIAALTALGGDLELLGSDDHDRVWLAATIHDDGPIRYYTYRKGSGEPVFLFAHRPDLDQYTLAGMEPFTVRARDGLTLHGYLTAPPGQPRRGLPAVVLVHGGPWHRDTWGYQPDAQWLANRGYLVIQTNFRGSTGYGKAFLDAGNRQWGAAMHDDLLDTLAWTIEQGWVDPTRVAIMGASYGAYAALIGAAFTPDVFACAVAVAAPADLNNLLTSIPPYWKAAIVQAHLRVGNPETEPEFLRSRSPLDQVDKIRIPVMVVHGGNDPRVPQADIDRLVETLDRRGVPVTYRLYPDEGHGLAKPANRLDFYATAEQFLADHLGGRMEPVGDDPDAAVPTTPTLVEG